VLEVSGIGIAGGGGGNILQFGQISSKFLIMMKYVSKIERKKKNIC
jgi:hypothetical protein